MDKLFLVAAGGAAGSVARYLTGTLTARWGGWPWATLTVNILGGLLMGLLIGTLALRGGEGQERLRLLLGVGFLGGFTTFSAFSLEVANMIERRDMAGAAGYAIVSVTLSVAAVFAGLMLARRVFA
ncbi:fluoride efflux transporter CrcB [Caulobacter sp. NIBR1757]|uniref:fluoride efflux transporter CrcB n=1 Tax=Caulobacter sp. NIBR1757 TaxID=3016000 RepID=UPI0022F02510|nr:fluoride efflux transporter CrcB [Caulobacter sp. NIBR1757]WGM39281.1 Putative fluoride ion transporter CrcB [Caulobacter sp. NIBR1757]